VESLVLYPIMYIIGYKKMYQNRPPSPRYIAL
jgi:hypothetical protein